MRRNCTRRAALGGVAAGIGAIAGCLSTDDPTGEEGAVTVGVRSDPTDDEWAVFGGVTPYYTQVFEPLVGASPSMEPEPGLATDWERTDEHTWRFDLRTDVTFHNGDPLTAADVVTTFEAVIDHWDHVPGWINLESGATEAVNDHTVVFETTEPFPTFPGTISHNYFGIVHPDSDPDDGRAIGTGPFQVETIDDGVSVTVVPSDDHDATDVDVESITFEVIEDASTRVNALYGGNVDLAFDPPRNEVSLLEDDEETATERQRTPRTCFGAVNIYDSPTDDERLRRALAYAVDQDRLVEDALEGIGDPASGPISPEIPWALDDELPAFGPDRDRARDLVSESTYDGEELTILVNGSESDDRTVGELLQGWFEDVGVDSEIRAVEPAAFYDTFTAGEANVTIVSLGSNSAASDYLVRAMFHSMGTDNRRRYQEDGTGIMNLGDEVDDLIEEGYQADSLEGKRDRYGEVQRRVVDAGVTIPLYYVEYVLARRSSVSAPSLHPIDKMVDFADLERES